MNKEVKKQSYMLEIKPEGLYLSGEPFFLVSGDIHYYRIYPGGLARRLELMKAFGLTAVQTYVPWNLHEPEKGRFVFDGLCDIETFFKESEKAGLKVLLRPSPYICSEWDMGGLPSWLLSDKTPNKPSALRCCDPSFLEHVSDYYKILCRHIVPYLSTSGGPVIAVAVENEYGSFGMDMEYMNRLRDMLRAEGIDVPLYTTDGYQRPLMFYGSAGNEWAGVNYRIESKEAIAEGRKSQPDKPSLIGEYWAGRSIHWGEPYIKRDPEVVAKGFREALDCGGLVNFYMFAGGTNFGFMNGANYGRSFSPRPDTPARYIPHTTTYDEDALLNEQGLPTKKYYACKRELWEYLGKPEPPMPPIPQLTQLIPSIKLKRGPSLWDMILPEAVKSSVPVAMEDMSQDYGYCLYRTEVVGCGEKLSVSIPELRDRADIFVNCNFAGSLMRDRKGEVSFTLALGEKARLDVLTENTGRINFGRQLKEKKGITDGFYLNGREVFGWECFPYAFDVRNGISSDVSTVEGIQPAVYTAEFNAEAGRDIYFDLINFNRGYTVVNGFNLGRYRNIGPQYTLYLPGELVKENNTVSIYEQYSDCGEKELLSVPGIILGEREQL